jgi:transcription termination factor Rho
MPTVLDRSNLEQSPLADLHVLANELGVDGFRRLRKAELVDAILSRSGEAAPGEAPAEPDEALAAPDVEAEGLAAAADGDTIAIAEAADAAAVGEEQDEQEEPEEPRRGRRGRRGGGRSRGRGRAEAGAADPDAEASAADPDEAAAPADAPEEPAPAPTAGGSGERVVEGVVELLANGSGFVRLDPPEPTDDDVYVSAAQIKRCELVSGDRVSGPVRAPRRSERFPSLVRVDTINGRPADEVVEGTRFEDLPVAWPSERLALESDDPTLKALETLTPFGKGSRVTVAGPPRAGKTEALKRLAAALAGREGLEVTAVLLGARPEELADWAGGQVPVAASLTFGASADAQAQALEQAVEQGRRVAARGGDAVLLIDGFEHVPPAAARRALVAARNLAQGGSLTIVATAPAPLGGETTVATLDPVLASLGSFPALALGASGTLRPELLVGEEGVEHIRAARAEQLQAQL